ncbi:MAG TPA: sigma-70 family RNA polymerase sigma factor [Anaerolineaceae bacterium]|nr:sigma-70 family RNA polymerase sigma factor [Anaerolineaceae bacterium]HPN50184.1 sigma-70 family RNA polymerase sigma factor [Anaerolineaceae bacterium]
MAVDSNTTPTSEIELIQQASKGDQEAFGQLYERYVGRIYNYIYYRTGNSHEAEDLTARVFTRAMNHLPHYEDRGFPFSAWLYRIAHNLVANWHRDSSRREEVDIDKAAEIRNGDPLPEAELVQNQEVERLIRVLQRFSPERQQLVILKFVEGLSNAEIGQIMERSEGAVKSLYHRTLLALRDELEREGQI